MAGDFNGLGLGEIAVYRPSDGTWHIRGFGDFPTYGEPGDIPITDPLNAQRMLEYGFISGF